MTERRDDYLTRLEFDQIQTRLIEKIEHSRELTQLIRDMVQDALQLQAKEYERRLTELNHAHAQAAENWARSLPREMFEAHMSDWGRWRDAVNSEIVQVTGLRAYKAEQEKWRDSVNAQLNQYLGGLILIRFMGFAGVLGLLISLWRLVTERQITIQ